MRYEWKRERCLFRRVSSGLVDGNFFGYFAFVGDLAQADVFEARPDESDGDDTEKDAQQDSGRASDGSFSADSVEAGERGGDSADLGEPTEDGQLQGAG